MKVFVVILILLTPALAMADATFMMRYVEPCGFNESLLSYDQGGELSFDGTGPIITKYCDTRVYATTSQVLMEKTYLVNPLYVVEIKKLNGGRWTMIPRDKWMPTVDMRQMTIGGKKVYGWFYRNVGN